MFLFFFVQVVIAASMWQNPHLLILDEPTNYLDRDGKLTKKYSMFYLYVQNPFYVHYLACKVCVFCVRMCVFFCKVLVLLPMPFLSLRAVLSSSPTIASTFLFRILTKNRNRAAEACCPALSTNVVVGESSRVPVWFKTEAVFWRHQCKQRQTGSGAERTFFRRYHSREPFRFCQACLHKEEQALVKVLEKRRADLAKAITACGAIAAPWKFAKLSEGSLSGLSRGQQAFLALVVRHGVCALAWTKAQTSWVSNHLPSQSTPAESGWRAEWKKRSRH